MRLKNFEVQSPNLIDIVLPRIENKFLALIKDFILVLSFTTLTAVSAKLKIEIGPIPITMQTFSVLLSGALLGSKRAFFSQLIYLLFGLLGIPWFSRGGGIQYVLSPTFGYIIGFTFASFSVGWLFERGFGKRVKTAILAMLIGNLILYLPGLFWLEKFVGWKKVLPLGFYPFILGDLLKISLAGGILPTSLKIIKRLKKFNNYDF